MNAPPEDETLEVVDEDGVVVGLASRARCHADPDLLHRAVHVFVFDAQGRVFLQLRSRAKRIQPGRWDTSVGGHVDPGESVEQAARREMAEELGLANPALPLEQIHHYLWRTELESELVTTFRVRHDGPFSLHPDEIEDGRFFSPDELARELGRDTLTPNLEHELRLLKLAPPWRDGAD